MKHEGIIAFVCLAMLLTTSDMIEPGTAIGAQIAILIVGAIAAIKAAIPKRRFFHRW